MLNSDSLNTLQLTSVICIGELDSIYLHQRYEETTKISTGILCTVNLVLLRRVTIDLPVTIINKLIFSDCIVALLNIPIILNIGFVYRFPCAFIE